MAHRIYFVIVAAGGGTRFGGDIPKQFRQLAGKPVLCHSIDAIKTFCGASEIDVRVILVLSPAGKDFWKSNGADSYPFVEIADGGASRAESVANALAMIESESDYAGSIIMVHDAARPMLSQELLGRLMRACSQDAQAVVPALAPTDSLMEKADICGAMPVDRSRFLAVQTPQAFLADTLISAYRNQKDNLARMTDEASVVFASTNSPIEYVDGDVRNIKITNPADLPLAEILLQQCSL